MRLWTRLDAYVLRELRTPFFLGLGGFTFVLLLNYLFLLAQQTIEKAVPLKLVLAFVASRLPGFLTLTMPMAALLAVLVGVGRLAAQNEILALRATGLSASRLFRPVLLWGLVLMAVTFGLSHYLHPMGRLRERALFQEILRARDFSKEVDPGVFFDRLPGAVLFASKALVSSEGRVFEGILLQRESSDGSRIDLILARRGQGEFDRETGQISLRLDDVEWHLLDPARPETYTVIRSPHETLTFPPDASFRARVRLTRTAGQKELVGLALYRSVAERYRELGKARTEGRRIAAAVRLKKSVIELSHRWAYPMAIPVLIFAAFPLAARTRRGGRFAGLSQAIGVIFFFWLLFSVGDGLAEQETLPPWSGAWIAHAAAVAWGTLLWRRLLRERRERPGGGLLSRAAGWLLGLFRRRRSTQEAASQPGPRLVQEDRWGGLTRIDSYLASGHLRMLFSALAVLLSLMAALGFKQAIDGVDPAAASFPWTDIFGYVGFSIPSQLQFLLPVAALFGVMVSLATLGRHGEIVAFKACGISPLRIAVPLLGVTLAISLVYAAAQESVVPAAEREAQRAMDRIRGRARAEAPDAGRRWAAGDSGRFWVYLDWDGRRRELAAPGLLRVDLGRARVFERIEAERAEFEDGVWRFENGWRRRFSGDEQPRFETFEKLEEGLPETPEFFGAARSRLLFDKNLADQMSFRDLFAHLRRVSRAGYPSAPLLVGLHRKLAAPLMPALLVLVGVPLIVSGSSRKGSLYGFGVALAITFGFWALLAVTTSLGRAEVLSPPLAVWLAPALLAFTGLLFLSRAR